MGFAKTCGKTSGADGHLLGETLYNIAQYHEWRQVVKTQLMKCLGPFAWLEGLLPAYQGR